MSKGFNSIKQYLLLNDKRRNLTSIFLMLGLILLFFLPGLLQFEKVMRVDGPWQAFPKMLSIARHIKNGEIPLWNPETFLGGKPFYSMYEGPLYNVFLYPFYLIADPDNYTQSYYVLYLIPYMLYVLFGALGFYYFGRKILKINYIGSIVLGLSYSLAPHIMLYIDSFHPAVIYALIPWTLYSICQYLENRKLKWWLLGLLFLVMMELVYDTNTIIRVYFVISVILFLIWIFIYSKREKPILTLFGLGTMFVFSICILAFMWTSIFEGVSWFKDSNKMTYKEIVKYFTSNVWPGFLVTLFIPNLTGLNPGYHAWGKAIGGDHNIIMTGGLAIGFCVFICIIYVIYYNKTKMFKDIKNKKKRDGQADKTRESEFEKSHNKDRILFSWIIISLIIYFTTILVMMGKNTFVYFILCKILPFLFEVPYPFYFRFAQCLSASILAGIGISLIFEHKYMKEKIINIKFITIYLFVVVIFTLIPFFEMMDVQLIKDNTNNNLPYIKSLLDHFNSQSVKQIPAYKTIKYFNELKWLLYNPFAYAALFFVFLIIFYKLEPESLKIFIFIIILFDVLFFGYISFYKNDNIGRLGDRTIQQKMNMLRAGVPREHPIFKLAVKLKEKLKSDNYRFISPVSDRDNAAWIMGERSACGYDGKPIFKNVQEALTVFMNNWPYHMTTINFPIHFLDNMNIGHLVIPEGLLDEKGIEDIVFYTNNPEYSRLNNSRVYRIKNMEVEKSVRNEIKSSRHHLIKLKEPMPYLYTLDKLIVLHEFDQLNELVNNDLRKHICINYDDAAEIPINISYFSTDQPDYLEYFKKEQAINRIFKFNRSLANKLSLNAEINKSTMLVRSEAYHKDWKVFINGKKTKVYNVNYLQQGIYLEPGEYEIVFVFFPESLKKGLILSLYVAVALLLFSAIWFIIERKKIKKD
ncbi:MAG: YfhO family protein [Spirochaetes bacterium]|nr:YfhO family protein [Spirochaetota bacterium]